MKWLLMFIVLLSIPFVFAGTTVGTNDLTEGRVIHNPLIEIFNNATAFVNLSAKTEIWITNEGDKDNVVDLLTSEFTNDLNWGQNYSGCADGYYGDGDGNCKEFNSSVESLLESTNYLPCDFAIQDGTASGNNNLGNLSYYDNEVFNITEASGVSPVLTINISFCNVTSFDSIQARTQYLGGQGHEIWIQLWDFILGEWESYSLPITDQATLTEIAPIGVTDALTKHINSSGDVIFRFWHEQNGITSHKLLIDYVNIVKNPIGITTIEHDSLGGRDSIENHPWAFATNGLRAMKGNANFSSYNLTEVDWGLVNSLNITNNLFVGNDALVGGFVNATGFNGTYFGDGRFLLTNQSINDTHINVSSIFSQGDITSLGNNICNATTCFTLQDLNTTGSGGGEVNDTNLNVSSIFVQNNISADSGFFNLLGGLINRITTLFVKDINMDGTLNANEGNITNITKINLAINNSMGVWSNETDTWYGDIEGL